MTELERRALAVRNTQARFEGRPFDWTKQATCIHLLRHHAANMGHQVPIVPKFRSALGAKRALLTTGWQTLPALLDSMFKPIPPAFALVGDVMAVPGEGFEALFVRAGVTKWIGWHQDYDNCTIVIPDVGQAIGAWRL
jgi:hypothetical protein